MRWIVKNKKIVSLYTVIICVILLSNIIVVRENFNKNYCRETEQSEKELTEISKKGERHSQKNYHLDYTSECISYCNNIFHHIFIISHLIAFQNTSFPIYSLSTEQPKRAPPFKAKKSSNIFIN